MVAALEIVEPQEPRPSSGRWRSRARLLAAALLVAALAAEGLHNRGALVDAAGRGAAALRGAAAAAAGAADDGGLGGADAPIAPAAAADPAGMEDAGGLGATDAEAPARPSPARRRGPLALYTAAAAVAAVATSPGGASAFPVEARLQPLAASVMAPPAPYLPPDLGTATPLWHPDLLDTAVPGVDGGKDSTATAVAPTMAGLVGEAVVAAPQAPPLGEQEVVPVPLDEVAPPATAVEPPQWMPALRSMCPGELEQLPGGRRFRVRTPRARSGTADVEVIEVKSAEDRKAALHAVTALEKCGGGDVVTLLKAASDLDANQVVLHWDEGAVFLVTDAADGDLGDVLRTRGSSTIDPFVRMRILVETLRGLRKLEQAGYRHRAVDPSNIKVTADCNSGGGCDAKVGGLAHARPLGETTARAWGAEPAYIAPEVWAGKHNVGKADVWSVGVLAYELFVGGLPAGLEGLDRHGTGEDLDLSQHPRREYMARDFNIANDERFQEFQKKDPQMAALIRRLLRRNVLLRPNLQRALRMAGKAAKSHGGVVPSLRSSTVMLS